MIRSLAQIHRSSLEWPGPAMLKNWVLLLYGTSEPIDKYDPVSIPRPILNRTATVSIPSKENVLQRGQIVAVSPSSAATTATITTVGVVKNVKGKLKNQVGQGNGKSAPRTKAQQQAASGNNRKGGGGNGKHEKNKEDASSGAKKKLSSSNSSGSSQRKYQGSSNAGGVGKSQQRQKHPKKELQALNELNRKSDKAHKGSSAATTTSTAASEKTIKAPKQVKETTSLRSQYWAPPRSSTTTPRPPPPPPGEATIITTSPSTASTASQTRLSKLLFQKYDRIQQVYPEFHPYVPPINEAEKKASLFLAVPNPNSKKQSGDGVKSFRENGKIIFFSDPDFFPATTKPVQRINPVTEQQQQQHRNGITYCKG